MSRSDWAGIFLTFLQVTARLIEVLQLRLVEGVLSMGALLDCSPSVPRLDASCSFVV